MWDCCFLKIPKLVVSINHRWQKVIYSGRARMGVRARGRAPVEGLGQKLTTLFVEIFHFVSVLRMT